MSKTSVLEHLAVDYLQLYLNPDTDTQETYRRVVLRGEEPGSLPGRSRRPGGSHGDPGGKRPGGHAGQSERF